MKILIVAGKFFPMIVGSGMATYFVASEIARRGHDVTVVIDREYLCSLKDKKLPFKVHYVSDYTAFMMGEKGFRRATEETYLGLSKFNFDVIHVFNYLPMLMFSMIRDLFNAPVVFTFWNTPYKSERAIGFYDNSCLDIELARTIIGLNKWDKLILGSQCSYKSALFLGANQRKTSFKYHGIDMNQFNEDLSRYSVNDLDVYLGSQLKKGDVLITLPGRITERKGIIEALHALKTVRKKFSAKLLLTGMSKPYSIEFSEIVLKTAHGLKIFNSIIIPSTTIPRHLMPALYRRTDVVITPSYYEGLGFTAIEALAAARPLVATSVPGLNEVGVNGNNCLMVPPRDEKKLAKAILKLLDDPRLADHLAQAGPNSVKKFDMKLFVDFIMDEYSELMNNNRMETNDKTAKKSSK